MSWEVTVDDAFIRDVESRIVQKDGRSYAGDIIAATLAVAAERGLVVPDDAPKMWVVRDCGCPIDIHETEFFPCREHADDYCDLGETVVRVAIVEIKEDGK
jgi:hypothetical protein